MFVRKGIGILTVLGMAISTSLCGEVAFFDNFFGPQAAAAQSAEQKTRLRSSKPKGTFRTYRGATRLERVEVRIKNVGDFDARDVSVQVISPTGSSYKASGPRTLAAHSDATYIAYPGDYVTSTKKIKTEFSCSNCYK